MADDSSHEEKATEMYTPDTSIYQSRKMNQDEQTTNVEGSNPFGAGRVQRELKQ